MHTFFLMSKFNKTSNCVTSTFYIYILLTFALLTVFFMTFTAWTTPFDMAALRHTYYVEEDEFLPVYNCLHCKLCTYHDEFILHTQIN